VPPLADVDKTVARAYSALGRMGSKRAVIVIDEEGIVRHRHDHLLGLDYQSVDDLEAALDALPSLISDAEVITLCIAQALMSMPT
jgi:peroxiredoxin